MEWTDSLSVGVDTVDSQHRELIRRVNAFYAALKQESGKEETLRVLEFLAGYVVDHFRDEEALQLSHNYPRYAEHRKLHRDFVENVRILQADIEANGVTRSASTLIAMTVTNWLVSHINVQDKDIGRHIKEKYPA